MTQYLCRFRTAHDFRQITAAPPDRSKRMASAWGAESLSCEALGQMCPQWTFQPMPILMRLPSRWALGSFGKTGLYQLCSFLIGDACICLPQTAQ